MEKKETFFYYNNKIFSKSKIAFSKGVNPCFGQKMPIFFVYVDLQRIRLKIMLGDFAQEKDTFLTIKDRIFHLF